MSSNDELGLIRATVRTVLRRDLGSVDHEKLTVPECPQKSCDTRFVGVNLEDYGVHLVKHHSLYRSSQRKLTDALVRESKRAEERQEMG